MSSRYDADRVLRRWIRRVAVTLLIAMVTSIVAVAGLAAWVVMETVPVIVVDGQGKPVPGAVVFDMDEAMKANPRHSRMRVTSTPMPLCGGCFGGFSMPCVPVSPQLGPAPANPASSGQSTGAVATPGASPILSLVTSPTAQTATPPISPMKDRVLKWLHPIVVPFGAALVWDADRPAYTGGAGEARVPASDLLTVMSPGDLRFEPGQVFAVEQVAQGTKGIGQPARFVLRAVQTRPAALEKRVYWSCNNTLFSDFVKLVESEIGQPVQVDKPSIEEEGIALDTPISVQVRDLPLRSALKIALGQFNLTFVWENQSIRITSKLQADNELESRIYPVADLLPGTGDELMLYADELEDVVQQTVTPNSWSCVGGAGEIVVFEPERSMFVRQTAAAHADIERLLQMLRSGTNPPPSDDEVRLMQALARPVTCDLENMELQTTLQYLGDLCDVPNILLDRPALEEEGIVPATRVSLRVHDVPLRVALEQLLRQWNLTWLIKDDVLVISSQLTCANDLEHRVYPVADLQEDPTDFDTLIELLQLTVLPNSWSCVGGAGTIQPFTPRSLLVVYQTQASHAQMEQVLTALRIGPQTLETEADRPVREAIEQTVSFDFRATRLDDAVQFLAGQAGIKNLFLDRPALEEEGVSTDLRVTLRGRHISVRAALRLLLNSLNLASDVRDGAVVITSELQLGNELTIRLYDVADLLGSPADPDSLIDLIRESVEPNSWDTVGGPGTVKFFPLKRYLVVQHTSEVHANITELLAQLRGRPWHTAPVDAAIRRSLRSIYDWTFDGGSLEALADRLSAGLDRTVILDRPSLEEAGISPSQPVEIVPHGESLESALKRELELIGVICTVRDEALVITTADADQQQLYTRAYSVHNLAQSPDAGDDLADRIQEQLSPDRWASVGGEGTVTYFAPTGQLVVYQSNRVHDEVEQFLAKLAARRNNQGG